MLLRKSLENGKRHIMRQRNNPDQRPSTIWLAYWEYLIAIRSGGVRITLAVFWLILAIAVALGIIRTQSRQNAALLAEQENQMVKEIFLDALNDRLDDAGKTLDDSTEKYRITKQLRITAKSPYLVSHASNLWNVSLFPSPLSALSVGASENWPDLYRIHGTSLAKTVKRNDQVRPITSMHGPFDTTFVVLAIAPLVVIGLTYNAVSRERESGLQKLMFAQAPDFGKLMAVRCFVRGTLVILIVSLTVNGALLVAFRNQFDVNISVNLVIWNLVMTLYLLIWAALSLLVNSFARSSATNGMALLLMWLILVMLLPRFVSNAVQQAALTLPERELATREQNSFDRATEDFQTLLQQFQSEHPETELKADDEQQMTLAKYLLAHRAAGREAPANVSSHYSGQLLRARYFDFCNWISPAISFRNQSDRCSGNSERVFVAFSVRAAELQAQLLDVFLRPSLTNQECNPELVAALPSLQEYDIPRKPTVLTSAHSIASIMFWLIVLTCIALRQFRVNNTKASRA